jgi:hypothetical protein
MNLFKANLSWKIKLKFVWVYIRAFMKGILTGLLNVLNSIANLFLEHASLFAWLLLTVSILFLMSALKMKCEKDILDGNTSNTLILNDTGLNRKQAGITASDTVIKFVNKIVYRQAEPVVIYYSKADTNLLQQLPKLDVMTNFEKNGDDVRIFAVNATDSTIKEYEFADIGPYFTVTSQHGKLFLKTRRAWWNGINIKGEYQMNNFRGIKNFDKAFMLGLESDFNLGTKFNIGVNPKYDFQNNDFQLNVFAKIKVMQ